MATDGFSVPLNGSDGLWPAQPALWSYSSLVEAEECPRRWMLSRATYTEVWPRSGYPPKPNASALLGDVVHRSLEVILLALERDGCDSLSQPCATAVLKSLGGYSIVVEAAITERLGRLRDNPRANDSLSDLRAYLISKVPEVRQRIQCMLARARLQVGNHDGTAKTGDVRRPLGTGSYPELELQAPDLGFVGRVDLLTVTKSGCEIIDYKTGIPHPQHSDQLRTYAVLWGRDTALNPAHLPVERLILAYPSHDDAVAAPSSTEQTEVAEGLLLRMREAAAQLSKRPPPALPSADACRFCNVRQLCDEYWRSPLAQLDDSALAPAYSDCEVRVAGQNGPRSWSVKTADGHEALLRTQTEAARFRAGEKVRLLDVVRSKDDEARTTTLTMTRVSEAFILK